MRIKPLQLTSAGRGVPLQRRPLLASLAGRLVPAGGDARWATVTGQRRSQLSADPLAGQIVAAIEGLNRNHEGLFKRESDLAHNLKETKR